MMDSYTEISQNTQFSFEEISMIGGIESNHGKYLKNRSSSARGPYQYTYRTFINSIKKYEKRTGEKLSRNRYSLKTQTKLMIQDINYFVNKNPKASIYDFYIQEHLLGYYWGTKFRKASMNTKISDILPESVIKVNRTLFADKTKKQSLLIIRKRLNNNKIRR